MGTVQCTSTGASSYCDQCDADVPASECYATRRAPESDQVALATDIALRWIEEHPAEEQIWDWAPGVLMFALTELHRVTGDDVLQYLRVDAPRTDYGGISHAGFLNLPGEIYQETSGPALFAYGIARAFRYGILGEQELAAALLALEGVKERIEPDEEGRPVVTGISLGTDPTTFEGYAEVEQRDDVHYGVGAVILALVETSGLTD